MAPKLDPKRWPAWRYGPNGESKLCQTPDDVPKGWEDTPDAFDPKQAARGGEAKPTLKQFGVTRKEAIDMLREAGVEVADDAPAAELAEALSEHFESDDDSSE